MSFGFATVGHFFASVAHDIVVGARAVIGAAGKAQSYEPEIEGLTALVSPAAVPIERAAFYVLGEAAAAAKDAEDATLANGLDIHLDGQVAADIKKLAADILAIAKGQGIVPPPAASAAAAAPAKQ